MTFLDCLAECAGRPDFVSNYDHLYKRHMGTVMAGLNTPIIAEIDRETGFAGEEVTAFAEFVYEFVWTRIPPEEKGKVTT